MYWSIIGAVYQGTMQLVCQSQRLRKKFDIIPENEVVHLLSMDRSKNCAKNNQLNQLE